MPVDFSIKQVPDKVAERLRRRARQNHRSLQGELRAILEAAVEAASPPAGAVLPETAPRRLGLNETSYRVVAPRSEAALMIRESREERRLTVEEIYAQLATLGEGTPDESTTWIREMRSAR